VVQATVGHPGDIPLVGDFDGDGKSDLAVWRPSEANWYIYPSSTAQSYVRQWGIPSDTPVVGDFDGDGKTDLAVWRPSEANWYIYPSSTGQWYVRQWGVPGDTPVVGDFDGDGKSDLAVWRPSEANWYIYPSSTGQWYKAQWGISTDKPILGDFDGDGKDDLVLWRASEANWYIYPSSTGQWYKQQWGAPGDIPIPNRTKRVIIAGQVLAGGNDLPGVAISLNGTTASDIAVFLSKNTDSNGSYSFGVPAGGTYTVTPSLSSYSFSPTSQTFSNIGSDRTANFSLPGNPDSGGGPQDGTPDPPPAPYSDNLGPVPSSGPGAPDCTNLSGSWSDTTGGIWQVTQNGSTVFGSLFVTQGSCSATWNVSGQATGSGNYSMTATPTVQNSCNPITASVALSVTSCTTGNALYTSTNSGGGSSFLGGTGGSTGGAASFSGIWSRESAPVTFSTIPSGSTAMSTGDTVQAKTTASLSTTPVNVTYGLVQFKNPYSTCSAGLTIPDGHGTGSATSTMSASAAGCSGIYTEVGAVGGTTTNSFQIVIPPQVLIQVL
jgi:hypothetical protein